MGSTDIQSAFAFQEVAASAWKKRARGGEAAASAGRQHDGWGSGHRHALDAQVDTQAGGGTATFGIPHRRHDRGTIAQGEEVFVAHQSQAVGPNPRTGAGSAVSLHRSAAATLPRARKS